MTLHSLLIFFFFFCFREFCTNRWLFLYFCTAPQVEIMKEYVDKTDKQTGQQTDAQFFHYNQPIALWHWKLVLHSISKPKIPLLIFLVKSQGVVLDSAIWRIFLLELKFPLHTEFCWSQIWTRPEQELICLTGRQRSKTVKIRPGVKWVSILAFDLSFLSRLAWDDARVEGT